MLSKVSVLLLVGLSSSVIGLKEEECPPTDSIPCKCTLHTGVDNTVGTPNIDCHSPTTLSEQDMGTLFATLQGYKLGSLWFINTTFETANEDMYKGLHLDTLVLEGVLVEKFAFKPNARLLTGLENSLKVLSVRNSFHKGSALQHVALDNMELLESATFHENVIADLGDDWFAGGLKRLTTVMFDRNEIQSLGDRVFQALENLSVLWLKGSDITEIKRSMLPSPGSRLEILDISSNKLTNLPSDLFSNLPALRIISLANNQITTLPESTFPKRAILFIDGNPLQCDQELKWICDTSTEREDAVCASPSNLAGTSLSDFCD